jgi:beta-glucosidase
MSDHPKIPRLELPSPDRWRVCTGWHWVAPPAGAAEAEQPMPTTTFPQEKGLGATWDPELAQEDWRGGGLRGALRLSESHLDRGGLVVRAPNADLSRDPRWGRTEESWAKTRFWLER